MDDEEPRSRVARSAVERALVRIAHHYGAEPEFVLLGGLVPDLLCVTTRVSRASAPSPDQAVPGDMAHRERMATEVFARMLRRLRIEKQILPSLVQRWERVDNFTTTIRLMAVFKNLSAIPDALLGRLEKAYQTNDQLYGSGFVTRELPVFVGRMKATRAKDSAPMRTA